MAKRKNKNYKKRLAAVVILTVLIAGSYFGFDYYKKLWMPNAIKTGKLYIPTHATYAQTLDSLKPFLKDENTFEWLAHKKKYDLHIKPGRYSINKGESNSTIINRLRSGTQDEIAVRIGNYSSIFELASKVSSLLEADSEDITKAITKADFVQGMDTASMITFFLPETYNFHWNTSGQEFVQRMKKQYDKFWTPEKQEQAKTQNMTALQVITLASIVQLESSKIDEQPRVAGLYLNRLKINMKLDADPTVIYALQRAEGFKRKIQRVYNKDLLIDSKYNTYKYAGLPPSPICMPNESAINAVLQPEQHNYLYFVTDPQKPGYHVYAITLKDHNKNAQAYHEWQKANDVR
jgi:UPF0755 protein